MHRSQLVFVFVPIAAALLLASAPSLRKDPNGVYGIVDSMRFEPTSEKADRVQVWGVFAMVDVVGIENDTITYVQFGRFKPAQRGYLHYTVNPRDETATRSEWAAMKAFAGMRQPIVFGAPFPPGGCPRRADVPCARRMMTHNGRLRSAGEPLAAPDTFPLRMPGWQVARVDSARAARFGLYDVP